MLRIVPSVVVLAVVISSVAISASAQSSRFLDAVREFYGKAAWSLEGEGRPRIVKKRKLEDACDINDVVGRRMLSEYGAMFLASKGAMLPWVCVFKDAAETAAFQKSIKTRTETIGGTTIKLQEPAMNALLAAIADAAREGKTITPRGGPTAAARAYEDTLRFWNNRFNNGLEHWMKQGRLKREDAERARGLPIREQIGQVLTWEAQGIYFSTGFNKTILQSVAAPGTSQHLFLLALDVTQFNDPRVREILMKHGWFQTVKSDQPHFTFLGRDEKELPKLGLKTWMMEGQRFWIPDFQ